MLRDIGSVFVIVFCSYMSFFIFLQASIIEMLIRQLQQQEERRATSPPTSSPYFSTSFSSLFGMLLSD
jgi:hypothetical protein